ncbi:MAG: hypothetical protein ACOYMZ_02675 [Minisyncoccia bacterium]
MALLRKNSIPYWEEKLKAEEIKFGGDEKNIVVYVDKRDEEGHHELKLTIAKIGRKILMYLTGMGGIDTKGKSNEEIFGQFISYRSVFFS